LEDSIEGRRTSRGRRKGQIREYDRDWDPQRTSGPGEKKSPVGKRKLSPKILVFREKITITKRINWSSNKKRGDRRKGGRGGFQKEDGAQSIPFPSRKE